MTKIKLFFLLILFFAFSTIYAAESQKLNIISEKKLDIILGSKSHNRISIKNDLVREIIGDDRLYKVIYPTFRNHIFILPKAGCDKINISLITESNIVMDLVINIVDTEGKTLILEVNNK